MNADKRTINVQDSIVIQCHWCINMQINNNNAVNQAIQTCIRKLQDCMYSVVSFTRFDFLLIASIFKPNDPIETYIFGMV